MSSITDPNITEANIRSNERNIDFEEGRTDADGKALIEPISIIEPSKQKSTTESINERRSWKTNEQKTKNNNRRHL